jgi:hypothetical protein
MMKSAKDRPSGHLAEPLGRPMGRRILVQGDVLPGNSLVVGLSPFEENGHEAEAI